MSARIRKLLCLLLGAALLCLMLAPAADALNPQPEPPAEHVIQVNINGSPLQMEVSPMIVNGRTLVPLRAIFEALGATVQWNPADQSIVASKGSLTIKLQIGSTAALNNGAQVTLDAAPMIVNGSTLVPVLFVSEALGAQVTWDAANLQVNIVTASPQTNPLLTPFIKGGPVLKLDPTIVKQITSTVNDNFRKLVVEQKLPAAQALQQEIQFLQKQPNIQDVTELPGGNLFVHFKGGYPLIMLLGQDTLGGPVDLQSEETTLPTFDKSATSLLNPNLLQPITTPTNHPGSNKALIFDCLDDDAWSIQHVSTIDVASDLKAMGYQVTTELNDDASLANAAQIANGDYGVVYMRGHGGVLPDGFGILTRPWSDDPMPWDSGYTGTWPVSFSSYATGSAVTMYGYAITSGFASAYWTQPFPGTMFFLESCHGTDPAGVPGLPTWTLNNGAEAWIGYDNDVSFNNGDNGSKLFFYDMALWEDASSAISNVESAGYLPPNLKLLPAGDDYTLNNRVAGVTISPRILTLNVGATSTPTATVAPSNAYNTAVTWSSDNTGVATVDPNSGLVTGVKAGYAHITATTVGTWSSGYPSADSVTVDVTQKIVIPITRVHSTLTPLI